MGEWESDVLGVSGEEPNTLLVECVRLSGDSIGRFNDEDIGMGFLVALRIDELLVRLIVDVEFCNSFERGTESFFSGKEEEILLNKALEGRLSREEGEFHFSGITMGWLFTTGAFVFVTNFSWAGDDIGPFWAGEDIRLFWAGNDIGLFCFGEDIGVFACDGLNVGVFGRGELVDVLGEILVILGCVELVYICEEVRGVLDSVEIVDICGEILNVLDCRELVDIWGEARGVKLVDGFGVTLGAFGRDKLTVEGKEDVMGVLARGVLKLDALIRDKLAIGDDVDVLVLELLLIAEGIGFLTGGELTFMFGVVFWFLL